MQGGFGRRIDHGSEVNGAKGRRIRVVIRSESVCALHVLLAQAKQLGMPGFVLPARDRDRELASCTVGGDSSGAPFHRSV